MPRGGKPPLGAIRLMSKLLIVGGLILILFGLTWPWLSQLPWGRLPGDLVIKRDNLSFYFPITTMILVSLVLSLVLRLFR